MALSALHALDKSRLAFLYLGVIVFYKPGLILLVGGDLDRSIGIQVEAA
jgi:hypothetical protein